MDVLISSAAVRINDAPRSFFQIFAHNFVCKNTHVPLSFSLVAAVPVPQLVRSDCRAIKIPSLMVISLHILQSKKRTTMIEPHLTRHRHPHRHQRLSPLLISEMTFN